jgi:hypothetical protein
MTGFDETEPSENDADRDDTPISVDEVDEGPEHDSSTPALENAPDPDEPMRMGGDDDLRAGQYGPDPTR